MDAIELGKDKAQQLNKFIELATQCIDDNKRDDAISLLSSAISQYPAGIMTTEEIEGKIPSRSEILTKLGIIFTESGSSLDPTGVHLFQQAILYDCKYVAANYYLGKILMNNGNIAEANELMERALHNSVEGDRFYGPAQKAIEEMTELNDSKDPIFATDYLIGQSMSHAIIDSPIGTFKKMSFDKIENKYDANVQMFPTDVTTEKLNNIREFNSNHGFEQTSFEEFLPDHLPLFEEHNQLSLILGEGYTLIDMGAEIYDVCGLNIEPQLTFTFYKLINNETNCYSYLLLAGKSPLELKDRQLSKDESFEYNTRIFDVYKNKIFFDSDNMIRFTLTLAKDYFNDDITLDNIANKSINGVKDETLNQLLEIHDDFSINDSRVRIIIDTNIKA
ncbi:hypothetical protein AKUH4B507X_14020 [Apilactobacillus kunkeei]|nr:hypothetical protein AKUH3B109M_12860 [Apilactobacillus kunkeei]CAI2657876.1 hypothetical protein AKUH3B101A_13550 [Apilactobacillus kunkeei]CAI2657888.1 hypothetical protein AKUH3B102A_13780 [Apilactobacillus kunkeei]CAI2658343.1 hypothetical protein AKUH3B203J_13680 [Apilactobacillus kunkeei]CAI2658580.1 hypothetical protein AKUH3B205J_13540 [Apilactobacillus kunkeei]